MNAFAQAVKNSRNLNTVPTGATANGGVAHSDSGDALVSLFFTIGSSRGTDLSDKFRAAYAQDAEQAVRMLFWARDVRGGSGERDTFRKLLKVLEQLTPSLAQRLVPLVSEYGRFDDLMAFENESVKQVALHHWAQQILSGNGLAAKWAPRKGPVANQLRKRMKMDPKSYRKWLVNHTQVVESAMCAKAWNTINYSHVPSVASSRYSKAFNRHDPVRYSEFKTAALKGDVKINAQALYPYDVLRNVRHGDATTALAQWENLPNYLGDAGFILPVVDTSASMERALGGSKGHNRLTCKDVAISLGLYLADKQQGAFANMFLNFDDNSKIHYLEGNLLEKLHTIERCEWGGSTNLESAFKEILRVAVLNNVPDTHMPKYLLILSDMGFNPATSHAPVTMFDMAQRMFEMHSYKLPTIVWWNLAHEQGGFGGDHNYPVMANTPNTVLVSGFSPSILKSVLQAKQVTPQMVMWDTIMVDRYAPVGEACNSL